MIQKINPQDVDNDVIHQENEYINPEYLEKIKEMQMIEAIKRQLNSQQMPRGDLYYEMQERQPSFDEFMRGYDPRFDPYGEE